jgi:hypothetical protein
MMKAARGSHIQEPSKVETDINRDIIWQIGEGSIKPVAMISIDPVWAAFRLKKLVERYQIWRILLLRSLINNFSF